MAKTDDKARGPVFVSGCPRSGTSALGWAIAACAEYWTSVETHFFYYLFVGDGRNKLHEAYKSANEPSSWLAAHSVNYAEFLASIGTGLDGLMRSRSNQLQWVDNSPENLLVADDLFLMFPKALIVHVVRDPRHVLASMLLSGFNNEEWSHDLDAGIATWKAYASAGLAAKGNNPDRVIEVRHSDMKTLPDRVANQLADRLQIADPKPISDFLQSSRINSSYDAASRLADDAGGRRSASDVQRRKFLQDYAEYILAECEPFASEFGFTGCPATLGASAAH